MQQLNPDCFPGIMKVTFKRLTSLKMIVYQTIKERRTRMYCSISLL